MAVKLLRDDLFRACSGSDHATAVMPATFPSDRTAVAASTACLVMVLLDPAAAQGRHPSWRMKSQCVALVAAFLLEVSSTVCSRLCWQAFTFLLGRPSTRGCSACGSVLYLPRRCSLRLLLFCMCPFLCAQALMPAWVWRGVRFYVYLYISTAVMLAPLKGRHVHSFIPHYMPCSTRRRTVPPVIIGPGR